MSAKWNKDTIARHMVIKRPDDTYLLTFVGKNKEDGIMTFKGLSKSDVIRKVEHYMGKTIRIL